MCVVFHLPIVLCMYLPWVHRPENGRTTLMYILLFGMFEWIENPIPRRSKGILTRSNPSVSQLSKGLSLSRCHELINLDVKMLSL